MAGMRRVERFFYSALVISLAVHVFALTVLFVKPKEEPQLEFKELKIRLGTKKPQQVAGAGQMAVPVLGAPGLSKDSAVSHALQSAREESASTLVVADVGGKEAKPSAKKSVTGKVLPLPPVPKKREPIRQQYEPAARQEAVPEGGAVFIPVPVGKAQMLANGNERGNSLEADAGEIDSYGKDIASTFYSVLQYPEQARILELKGLGSVILSTDRSGKVLRKRVYQSAGHPMLDQAMVRAIDDAGNVPPAPKDYHPERDSFTYVIGFKFGEEADEQN